MTQPIVVTEQLTKRYGSKCAVEAVSLTVRRGEVYGFLGPNGAGKTTTLRMLVGLIRPSSGRASVLGHPPGAPEIASRTGVLIEGPGFYPYLSGRDNLRVLARYRGCDDDDVERALGRVGLRTRGDDTFKTYSLGMKQRLGVWAALLGNPDLLVLDEPTNGLDPAGMAEMRQLIVDLAAAGHSILLSSHMLAEVQQICDRVGVIADGRFVVESTVADLRGASTLFVRADPVGIAFPAVRRAAAGRAMLTDNGIRVDDAAELAPAVARAVVEAGADLLELRSVERSLEDVFFEMTSSEKESAK